MKSLIDKKHGILWYLADESKETKEINSELNHWQSAGIDRFIINTNEMKLGAFSRAVQDFQLNKCFFGYIDGELAALVVIHPGDDLKEKYFLMSHIMNTEWGSLKGVQNCLSYEKAKKIMMYNNKNNNDTIQYLVVSPERQGRGYGTRIVCSIKDNIDFFAEGSSHNSLSTQIHPQNIASQKVFERNNFKTLVLNEKANVCLNGYYLEDDLMVK